MSFADNKEELKMFVWYLVTNPWRVARASIAELFHRQTENVKGLRSYKTWSIVFFSLSMVSVFADDAVKWVVCLAISFVFYLLYEWTSKKYRHEWKQHKIRQLKAAHGQEVRR